MKTFLMAAMLALAVVTPAMLVSVPVRASTTTCTYGELDCSCSSTDNSCSGAGLGGYGGKACQSSWGPTRGEMLGQSCSAADTLQPVPALDGSFLP